MWNTYYLFGTSSVSSKTGVVTFGGAEPIVGSFSSVGVEQIGVRDDVYHWLLGIGRLKASLSIYVIKISNCKYNPDS